MKCNTVFISSICYHLFILFLAFRNIGKNIYIYSRLQNQPCFFCFIFSHLLSRALIWLGHFRPFWIISFEFVKVCWIRFSSWESFISFSIWCYPISSILARLFIICEKRCVGKGAWLRRCHLVPPALCIVFYGGWIWEKYHENSESKFHWQLLSISYNF